MLWFSHLNWHGVNRNKLVLAMKCPNNDVIITILSILFLVCFDIVSEFNKISRFDGTCSNNLPVKHYSPFYVAIFQISEYLSNVLSERTCKYLLFGNLFLQSKDRTKF